MTLTYAFAPIVKREKTPEGHLILHGKATGPDLDLDEQICDADWLKSAMPEWFATGANIREMHQAKAVGKGVELEAVGDDWQLTSKVIDRDAVEKCDEEIYTGYSIGIKNARVVKDATARNGRIVGGQIIEVSIVDRPANPTAKLVAVKAAVGDDIQLVDDTDLDVADKTVEPDEVKRDYSDDERADMADNGQAMPGGGFPIKTTADLKNAIQAIGRAKNPTAAREHIKQRAQALGATDLIPESWKAATPDGSDDEWTHNPDELKNIRDGLARLMQAELDELMSGENEVWDVSELLQALQLFLCWWEKEAWEGETPAPDVDDDVEPATTTVQLAAEPDPEPTTLVEDTAKTVDPDTTKNHPLDPDQVERLIADAVTKATQSQEAALSELRDELAEVKKMAAPGGPSRLPSQLQKATATRLDHLRADHARYSHMAETVTDPVLRQGYREAAKALEPEIAKLTN